MSGKFDGHGHQKKSSDVPAISGKFAGYGPTSCKFAGMMRSGQMPVKTRKYSIGKDFDRGSEITAMP
jgi:hypothetical protein